jgi:hypothetical protein
LGLPLSGAVKNRHSAVEVTLDIINIDRRHRLAVNATANRQGYVDINVPMLGAGVRRGCGPAAVFPAINLRRTGNDTKLAAAVWAGSLLREPSSRLLAWGANFLVVSFGGTRYAQHC